MGRTDMMADMTTIETPSPQATSCGARLFQIRDPDGVSATFLQWREPWSKAA
jgi:hypothetical protein